MITYVSLLSYSWVEYSAILNNVLFLLISTNDAVVPSVVVAFNITYTTAEDWLDNPVCESLRHAFLSSQTEEVTNTVSCAYTLIIP